MSIVINDDVIAVEKYSQAYEYKSLGLFEGQYTGYKYPLNFHINNIDYKDYVPAIAVRTDEDFSSTSNNFTHYLDEYEGTNLTYANLTGYRRVHKWYINNYNTLWNGFIGFRVSDVRSRGGLNAAQYIQNSIKSGNYGLLYILMLKREHVDYYKHCVENKIEPDFSIFEFWTDGKISTAFYYSNDWRRLEEHLSTLEIKVKYGNFNNLIGVPNLSIPKTPTKRRKIASEILNFLEQTRVEENGRKKVLIQSSDTKVSNESNAIQEQESSVLLQDTR